MNSYDTNLTIPLLYKKVLRELPFSWFPTPPKLMRYMLKLAAIKDGIDALDPTAGCGCLAEGMQSYGAKVDVIEINPSLRQLLYQKGLNLVGSDFFRTEPIQQYRLILANPPFSSPTEKGIDTEIIIRAYKLFLQPGGRLISVVSASKNIKNCPKAQNFRSFLKATNARVIELPLEIFWGSSRQVTVETSLVIINKKKLKIANY
ncbi:MAG: class I SAM-dependent methyltransferase [Crinalium sp.]